MKTKDIILMIISTILIISTYIILCEYKNYIEIKDGKQNLSLYEDMLSYSLDDNRKLVLESDYIAIDINSFTTTNEQERNKLINYLRNYGSNIILAPFATLNNKSFKNEDDSLKGIFISIDNMETYSNKIKCNFKIYKSSIDEIVYKVTAKYSGSIWKIKYVKSIS